MRFILAAATVAALPAAVFAATPQHTPSASAGLQDLREVNLTVLGNLSSRSEVEGKTFVGGSLSGQTSNYGIGNSTQGATVSARPTLTVGGNIGGGGINLANGLNGRNGSVATRKSVDIGGSLTGGNFNVDGAKVRAGSNLSSFNINGGTSVSYGGTASGFQNTQPVRDATLAPGGANDLSAAIALQTATMRADLGALSAKLGSFAADSTINTRDPNNVIFASTGGADRIAVFNIADGVRFFSQDVSRSFSFALTGVKAAIINVHVTAPNSSLTIGQNFGSSGDAVSQKLIWNFISDVDPAKAGITSISVTNKFVGSLLAIRSDLKTSNFIAGAVAVASLSDQGGEVHLGTYDGAEVSAVPEPTVWLQLLTGFGVAGAAIRRQRAKWTDA